MLLGNEIVHMPVEVLIHYEKLGMSDKELLCILHFSAVQDSGKRSWELVSERMGYNSVVSLSKLLENLVTKGLVSIDGFTVDASPLISKCKGLTKTPIPVTLLDIPDKPVNKKTREHYNVYQKIKDIAPNQNENAWAATVKKLMENGATESEIIACCNYMESYLKSRYKGDVRTRISPKMLQDNYQSWVNGGKKSNYKTELFDLLK
jgi:DNA replication protein DnaD